MRLEMYLCKFVYCKKYYIRKSNNLMKPEEPIQKQYEFYYDAKNPDTLVALKRVQLMSHLGASNDAVFSNIITLPNPMAANIYKISLMTMIRQPVATQVMINQFCNLARFCYPDQPLQIKQFEREVLSHARDNDTSQGQHLLTQYVKQTFYHKLLNNLLRTSCDSLEIFYGHYFVQKMNIAIKQSYKKSAMKNKQFVCYRGCYLTEEQISTFKKEKGKYFETLGFLSTSLSQSVALSFACNAIFEIVVPNRQMQQKFDQGYVCINSDESEVLFNVLCSFQILQVATIKRNSVQILKVKLKYGELAHLMSKYNSKEQIDSLTDLQKQIILSVAHQSFQSGTNQQCTFHQQGKKLYYLQTLLNLIENCPSYNRFNKQSIEAYFMGIKNRYISEQPQSAAKIVRKGKQLKEFSSSPQFDLVQLMSQIGELIGMSIQSKQYQTKGNKVIDRIQKMKPSMLFMKEGIEKGKNILELTELLSDDIHILGNYLQIKMELKRFSVQQVSNDINQQKQRIKRIFGEFHPFYTNILSLEAQFEKINLKNSSNQSIFQKWKQFMARKEAASPETLQKEYFILKKLQGQAFLVDPKNWVCELCDQKYNKHVQNNPNYSSSLKEKIHQALFEFFFIESGALYRSNKLVQCKKLIERMKSNPYYSRDFYDENLDKIKVHQIMATKMYMNSLQLVVTDQQYKTKQCKEYLISIMHNKLNNITINVGKDSYLYVGHRCFHIYTLMMLGLYEEAEVVREDTLQEIAGSPRELELRQFINNELNCQN